MLVTIPAIGRRGTSLCVRTTVILLLATLFWIQLHVTRDGQTQYTPLAYHVQENYTSVELLSVATRPAAISHLDDISMKITRYNDLQTVINEAKFGPVTDETIVIVVQVHKRLSYLHHLIDSFSKSRDIDSVLLVFSHDHYDEEINELLQTIAFCKVMQIFYPHSIQTHPNQFPGESPQDCPRNIKKEQAMKLGCINALHPDSYGHYREAKFTQIKHHWWWKANRVFNQLTVTRNHKGVVLFLEEDHYVAQDFIHILRLLQATTRRNCPQCNILSLGSYQKKYNYVTQSDKVEITQWTGNKHNMGMAMNRTTWSAILDCSNVFCSYDDYNWDWSIQYSGQQCLPKDLIVAVMKQPRVFHLGECGLHHNKRDCEPTAALKSVQSILQSASDYFFPQQLYLSQSPIKRKKLTKSNGGWGDVRDHQLCLNMSITAR